MNPKFTQEVLDLTKNPNFNFSVDADPINKTTYLSHSKMDQCIHF